MKLTEMKIAADKLKNRRNQQGWTQQHLADISGISLRTIQRAESSGNTSTDTISALSAVFEVERSYWQTDTFSTPEKNKISLKGWSIALISIALTQIFIGFCLWLFLDEINLLWLKVTLASWFGLGLITFIIQYTFKKQNITSYSELKLLQQKIKNSG